MLRALCASLSIPTKALGSQCYDHSCPTHKRAEAERGHPACKGDKAGTQTRTIQHSSPHMSYLVGQSSSPGAHRSPRLTFSFYRGSDNRSREKRGAAKAPQPGLQPRPPQPPALLHRSSWSHFKVGKASQIMSSFLLKTIWTHGP